jgi:cytochrome c oxidase subunit 2
MTIRSLGRAFSRLALVLGAAWAFPVWAVNDLAGGPKVNQYDLHPPASAIAAEMHWLHNFMLIVCLVIFFAVFGVMFYSIIKHRKSKGARAANFHESTTVEIAWTVVPFIIVILMALPATRVVVAMKDTSAADLTVKATGYQWKWGYDYLNGEGAGIGFLSTLDPAQREASDAGKPVGDDYLFRVDNPLVVPVNKKVRMLVTAADVIHNWWVPDFGMKKDAIPGYINELWFRADQVGTYRGQCAELCGRDHGFMPVVVRVVEQAEYDGWLASQKAARQAATAPAAQTAAATTTNANETTTVLVANAE